MSCTTTSSGLQTNLFFLFFPFCTFLHVNCNDVIHQGAELRDTLREADVPVIHQVRGAFEDLIRGAARGRYFRQKSKKTRNGIVPDLRWRDEDGEFVQGDVKTIGFGKTRYWGRRPASTRAVDARATQWRRLMCTPCADPTSSRHIALQRSSTQARTG